MEPFNKSSYRLLAVDYFRKTLHLNPLSADPTKWSNTQTVKIRQLRKQNKMLILAKILVFPTLFTVSFSLKYSKIKLLNCEHFSFTQREQVANFSILIKRTSAILTSAVDQNFILFTSIKTSFIPTISNEFVTFSYI